MKLTAEHCEVIESQPELCLRQCKKDKQGNGEFVCNYVMMTIIKKNTRDKYKNRTKKEADVVQQQ